MIGMQQTLRSLPRTHTAGFTNWHRNLLSPSQRLNPGPMLCSVTVTGKALLILLTDFLWTITRETYFLRGSRFYNLDSWNKLQGSALRMCHLSGFLSFMENEMIGNRQFLLTCKRTAFFKFKSTFYLLCPCVLGVRVLCYMMWRSEDNLRELVTFLTSHPKYLALFSYQLLSLSHSLQPCWRPFLSQMTQAHSQPRRVSDTPPLLRCFVLSGWLAVHTAATFLAHIRLSY